MGEPADVDVLVITALREELDALLEAADQTWTLVDGDPPHHLSHFEGRDGPVVVAAARATGMGGVGGPRPRDRRGHGAQGAARAVV